MPFKCEAWPCEWRLRRFGHTSVSDFSFQAFVPINFEGEYANADDGSNSAADKNRYRNNICLFDSRNTDLVYGREEWNCPTQNATNSGKSQSADNACFMVCQHI